MVQLRNMAQPLQNVSFYNEVSLMMFGFGDSHKPNPDTVKLVESIVCKQLRVIIEEASKYSEDDNIDGTHLIFLLRRNKWKMRRFVKYLMNKQLAIATRVNVLPKDDPEEEPSRNPLLDFIEGIDETGELTDLTEIDEIVLERQVRADRMSIALDTKKYMEFSKARSSSFSIKQISGASTDKLQKWLDPVDTYTYSKTAMEVLSYYAYQTVAELTDYALLVRMDAKRTSDPVSNLSGAYYNATMFKGEHRFSGANPDFSSAYQSGQMPITVDEIQEVMRRCTIPQAGKLKFGRILPVTHYLFAL